MVLVVRDELCQATAALGLAPKSSHFVGHTQ